MPFLRHYLCVRHNTTVTSLSPLDTSALILPPFHLHCLPNPIPKHILLRRPPLPQMRPTPISPREIMFFLFRSPILDPHRNICGDCRALEVQLGSALDPNSMPQQPEESVYPSLPYTGWRSLMLPLPTILCGGREPTPPPLAPPGSEPAEKKATRKSPVKDKMLSELEPIPED